MNGSDFSGGDNNILATLAGLLAKKKSQQEPIALPNGGLEGQALQDEMAINPGPVATTGLNPNNPGPEDVRNKSLFERVSAQMQKQQGDGNLPSSGGNPEMSRKLAAVSKLAGVPAPTPEAPLVQEPAKPADPYGDDLGDKALVDAQAKAKRDRALAGFLRAGNTFGNAVTKGALKVDNSFADNFEKQAGQGVTDINDRRTAKDKELARQKTLAEMSDESAMRDVNSPVSKSIREGLQNLFPNMKLPDNVSAKQLKDLGINYGTLVAAKESADARREAAAQRASDKDETRKDKLEKQAQLSDKQVTTVAEYDKPLKMLDSIIADKTNFDTGPLAGRWNTMASWVGMDDSKKSGFRSDVGDALAQYIKGISGAAVSESERRALLANLPTMNDNDKTFTEKARRTKERLTQLREIEVGLMEKQGKNVKNFKSEGGSGKIDSDPRVDSFMEANGITDRNEAIKILKDNGKI
jgi:hypothetical protein